ncbi:pentapeptide repeat-containing protein [Streptomyces arenae]|nr:pentapeptide repeat-containing protein [Streptomyces arenae]
MRLAGIYALQRIMQDSPRDQPSIVNLLCAYVRTHARLPKGQAPASQNKPKKGPPRGDGKVHALDDPPKMDVAAVLEVIGNRDPQRDGDTVVNLSRTDLSWAQLDHARLPGAIMDDARLMGARFSDADLSGAELDYADLRDAIFMGADMRRVKMAGADLDGADLGRADLREAVDLPRSVLLGAMPDHTTKLPPRLAQDPLVKRIQGDNSR